MESEKKHKRVAIANEKGEIVGSEDMLVAVEKGMIRCSSRVFVFNETGQVLIQRRSVEVFEPCRLDISIGGHLDEGETYYEAAYREAKEEMDLEDFELKEVASNYYSAGFFSSIYKIVIPNTTSIKSNRQEVDEVLWLSSEELDLVIVEREDECTSSLKDSWITFRDKLIAA